MSQEKYIFEIDTQGDIVWDYNFENIQGHSGNTARAKKYELNYLDTEVGDLTSDHLINIYDLVAVIELIMDGHYHEKADQNSDGEVNNVDIDILTELIMNL